MCCVDASVHSSKCDFRNNRLDFFLATDTSHIIRCLRLDAGDDNYVDEHDYDYFIVDHSYEASKRSFLPHEGVDVLTGEKVSILKDTYNRRLQMSYTVDDSMNYNQDHISVLMIHPEFWLFEDLLDPAMSWLLRYQEWTTIHASDSIKKNVKFDICTVENPLKADEARGKGSYSNEWPHLPVHMLFDWVDENVNADTLLSVLSTHDVDEIKNTLPKLCSHLSKYDVVMYKDSMFIVGTGKYHIFEVLLHRCKLLNLFVDLLSKILVEDCVYSKC